MKVLHMQPVVQRKILQICSVYKRKVLHGKSRRDIRYLGCIIRRKSFMYLL